MFVLEITPEDFQSEVLNSCIPVIVNFWATWYQPCEELIPSFESIAEEYQGEVRFLKIKTDQANQLFSALDVKSVPTLQFYQNGNLQHAMTGLFSKEHIRTSINLFFE
jgi:thioredoxin 1